MIIGDMCYIVWYYLIVVKIIKKKNSGGLDWFD